MKIISSQEQNRMSEANELRELIAGDYIYSLENENSKYILQRFFNNKQYINNQEETDGNANIKASNKKGLLTETLRVMNVGSGLFSTISSIIANYVGNPEIGEINIDVNEQTQDMISTGYCIFTVSVENGETKINYVPSYNYTEETGVPQVIRIYEQEDEKGNETYYAFVRSYLVGTIKNDLYELEDDDTMKVVRQVPLQTIPQTANLQDIETTNLTVPSIFKVKLGYDEYGQSEFQKVKSLIYSIERKMVMFENEFLRNVESFVIFKGISFPETAVNKTTGKANIAKIGRYLTSMDADAAIEFVNNQNDLIKDAIEYVDRQIHQISAITNIPTEFLSLESKEGSIGKGSRSLRHGSFIKKIEKIRETYNEAFNSYLFPILSQLGDKTEGVVWQDVFAKSDNELIEELQIARDAGLISQKRAIGLYLGLEEAEAEKEMELINNQPTTNANPGDKNQEVPNGNGTTNDQKAPQ